MPSVASANLISIAPIAILKRHPHLKALVVERAQVIQGAAQYWEQREERSLLERMSFQAGDLLASVPQVGSSKDIYLLSAVLHGITVLRNLASASSSAGTGAPIALMEMVMPESCADLASASFDMQMFMGTRGRERTLAEWQRLFDKSGVVLQEVVGPRMFRKIPVLPPCKEGAVFNFEIRAFDTFLNRSLSALILVHPFQESIDIQARQIGRHSDMLAGPRKGTFSQLRIPPRAHHFLAVHFSHKRVMLDIASVHIHHDGIHVTPPYLWHQNIPCKQGIGLCE